MKVHSVTKDDIITVLNDLNIRRPKVFAYGENQIPYGDEEDPKYLTVKLENKEIANAFMKANEGDEMFDQELFPIRTLIQQINNTHNLKLNNNNMYTLICGIHNSEINKLFQNTSIDNITIGKNTNAQLDNRKIGTRIFIKGNNRIMSYFVANGNIYDTHYIINKISKKS